MDLIYLATPPFPLSPFPRCGYGNYPFRERERERDDSITGFGTLNRTYTKYAVLRVWRATHPSIPSYLRYPQLNGIIQRYHTSAFFRLLIHDASHTFLY